MEHSAKNFALQLGSLLTLYVSVTSLLVVLFGVITLAYPDSAAGYWEQDSAQGMIRFGIATLVVFFPAYLVLTRMVNTARRSASGDYTKLTKWLIYLSLVVGGGVLLGDLVAIINTFLNGELAVRFALKALSVLVVVGAAFVYYVLDSREYWQSHEKESIRYGIISGLLVSAAIVVGFLSIQTPTEVREDRLDDRQVQDLQDMQWRIEEYYRVEGTLPQTIESVYSGLPVPTAPEERDAYRYTVTGANSFELCATFAQQTTETNSVERPVFDERLIKNPYNWDHGAGVWCFTRVVTDLDN